MIVALTVKNIAAKLVALKMTITNKIGTGENYQGFSKYLTEFTPSVNCSSSGAPTSFIKLNEARAKP